MTPTLAELLRTRDPEAMDRMLAEYGKEIQGVAYLILHDRSDAEDVLAETVIAAWQSGRTSARRARRRLASGGLGAGFPRLPRLSLGSSSA